MGRDETLFREVQEALAPLAEVRVVVHAARDLTRAVDVARARRPDVVLVEMTGDLEAFRATVGELAAASPETVAAGVYRAEEHGTAAEEGGGSGAAFVEAVRAGARDFLRRPVSTSDLRQLLDRTLPTTARSGAPPPGSTIAFVSNKGGVGKSTLAVNAAAGLARRHPGEVLLVDASLQMGLCAPMLDLRPTTTLLDTIRERDRLDSTLIRQLATPHDCGLDLLAAPPDALSATEIDDELLTRVLNLARRTYAYVLVDTFPLFDRIVMSVVDAADVSYVVLDNVVPTVLSVVQLLRLLDEVGCPQEGRRVVVNRFLRVPGNPGVADVSRALHREVDHVLPFDRRALTAANTGRPFALTPRLFSRLDRGLRGILAEIERVHGNGAVRGTSASDVRREPESDERA